MNGVNYALSTGTKSSLTLRPSQDVLDEAGLETAHGTHAGKLLAELAAQVYEATGGTQATLVGKDALRNLLRAYGLDLFNLEGSGSGL